jgi:alkylhydroperoxidase/carboxymuconolactone decarboxylase family protein YurZ
MPECLSGREKKGCLINIYQTGGV